MTKGKGAFAFQTGDWRVVHRKLKGRLVGSSEWIEFSGTCSAWELLGGEGNVDDHFIDDPNGAYHAATFRRTDPQTGLWWIWWFDPRHSSLEPPVVGGFEGDVGSFYADDHLDGRPIMVRYLWLAISDDSARWEQAFSPDSGRTWETNWIMRFERER